jgi:hypothetical protein
MSSQAYNLAYTSASQLIPSPHVNFVNEGYTFADNTSVGGKKTRHVKKRNKKRNKRRLTKRNRRRTHPKF